MSLLEDFPPQTTIKNIHDETHTSKSCAKTLAIINHINEKIKWFKNITARPKTKTKKLMFRPSYANKHTK